jgi:hypothetical protein
LVKKNREIGPDIPVLKSVVHYHQFLNWDKFCESSTWIPSHPVCINGYNKPGLACFFICMGSSPTSRALVLLLTSRNPDGEALLYPRLKNGDSVKSKVQVFVLPGKPFHHAGHVFGVRGLAGAAHGQVPDGYNPYRRIFWNARIRKLKSRLRILIITPYKNAEGQSYVLQCFHIRVSIYFQSFL